MARTYLTITETIDFEVITAKKIQYFLYKNLTEGAKDADGTNGFQYIVEHVVETCQNNGFEALSDIHKVTAIRDNLDSYYMKASEIFIMLLMLFSAFMACVWIPYNMNEYGMPIYFRDSNSNVFLDLLNLRIIAFAYFITLSGTLAHF